MSITISLQIFAREKRFAKCWKVEFKCFKISVYYILLEKYEYQIAIWIIFIRWGIGSKIFNDLMNYIVKILQHASRTISNAQHLSKNDNSMQNYCAIVENIFLLFSLVAVGGDFLLNGDAFLFFFFLWKWQHLRWLRRFCKQPHSDFKLSGGWILIQ